MSGPNIPTVSFAALNDYELEVLRLLASGHTAKSIAARLGRSETAINERLRDARRKTGVSSSRELARLLDAQKIWDKNIDLVPLDPSDDTPDQPRLQGLEWTKGRIAMLIAIPAALLGLAVVTGDPRPAETETQQAPTARALASPLAGRWSLDISRIPAEERPQSVTIAFAVSSDGKWTTKVEIVHSNGLRMEGRSTAALDGVAVPVSGSMGFIDSISLRQPQPDTLVMTLGKDGQRVATRVYTTAEDGKSMIETIVWSAQGLPDSVTTTFKRVS
jgi:DNA-binding CsgD family transcriptional regulator